jgi:hypothetical protein
MLSLFSALLQFRPEYCGLLSDAASHDIGCHRIQLSTYNLLSWVVGFYLT